MRQDVRSGVRRCSCSRLNAPANVLNFRWSNGVSADALRVDRAFGTGRTVRRAVHRPDQMISPDQPRSTPMPQGPRMSCVLVMRTQVQPVSLHTRLSPDGASARL